MASKLSALFFLIFAFPLITVGQSNLTVQEDSTIYMSDFYSCRFDIERAPYGTPVIYWELKLNRELFWGQGSDHTPGTRSQKVGSWRQVNDSIILSVDKHRKINGLVIGEQRFKIFQLKWITDTGYKNIKMTSYCILLINDSSFNLSKTIQELKKNLDNKMTAFIYDPKDEEWMNSIIKHHNFDETVRQFFNSQRVHVSIKMYNGKNLTPWTM
jgi:hypothetical protein